MEAVRDTRDSARVLTALFDFSRPFPVFVEALRDDTEDAAEGACYLVVVALALATLDPLVPVNSPPDFGVAMVFRAELNGVFVTFGACRAFFIFGLAAAFGVVAFGAFIDPLAEAVAGLEFVLVFDFTDLSNLLFVDPAPVEVFGLGI